MFQKSRERRSGAAAVSIRERITSAKRRARVAGAESALATTLGSNWSDWLIAQVIDREAQATLAAESDSPADPFGQRL